MKRSLALLSVLCASTISFSQQSPREWGGAKWVWDAPDAASQPQSNDPRYLRRTFDLTAKAEKAELWITADNRYTAYVNGHKVGSDGEWNSVEKYDVAKHLVPGKNVLAVEARNEGGPAGIIARLKVKPAGGKDLFVVTDGRTRISQSLSKDWLRADFDDSAWLAASVLGDVGMGPWNVSGAGGGSSGKSYDVGAVDPKVKARQSAEEQRKHFVVPEGFEVELVAADPLVINPITLAVDEKGRLYVSESHTYRYGPSGSPVKPFANPVVRLDPLPGGKGFKRTLVADGFDDPVMGIAVRGDKLWLTANNFLYQYDLTSEGKAINRKTLAVDKNKAWNPFGMFVLEWGPDGLLYMSVGNHPIAIQGPDGKIDSRGGSGVIMRMNPDGTKMERLVQGLRVPYSFEYDPFGQLWLLSNGEGNPNRFVRVIEGVDYHCYSRPGVDNTWLAGDSPLAPPCIELHRGADTQLVRYYGAAFPEAYRGSLLLDNWGGHGFPGLNRGVFRFVPDARNHIVKKEPFLSCTDPHFRPSHVVLDPDGNLLVADWYGRDDESDLTGRIWRVKYTGKDKPALAHKLDSSEWSKDEYALSALGSPSHRVREKATNELVRRGNAAVGKLADHAAAAKEPLAAANALWALWRIGTPEAKAAVASGGKNADWRVRRLAVHLLRRGQSPDAAKLARELGQDTDPAVRVEAALALNSPEATRSALVDALNHGAANDSHLRYEAAWHLAKCGNAETFGKLLASGDEGLSLAGLIAIDVACYENFATKKAALAALAKALEAPGKLDLGLALHVARLDGDASLVPALEKLITRPDLSAGVVAQAVMVLKAKGGALSKQTVAAAGKRLLEAVASGAVPLRTPADQLLVLDLLESEGPSEFALRHLAGQVRGGHPSVRPAALALARKFGTKAAPVANSLWPGVFDPRARPDDALDMLATLAVIEPEPRKAQWERLLTGDNALLRTEAVRDWRAFKGRPEMVSLLVTHIPELLKRDPALKDDLATVLRQLDAKPEALKALDLPAPAADKDALGRETLAGLAKLPPPQRQKLAAPGRQVFARAGCVKCHTTVTDNTPLAPTLKGIGAQKFDYLVESVLYPSKVIKTGFESETVITKDGERFSGLVKDEGKFLRVLNLDRDTKIAKDDVESRMVQKVSVMPEGQEALMSRREFLDLIAYLASLR